MKQLRNITLLGIFVFGMIAAKANGKFSLITDRQVYVSGEKLLAKIYLQQEDSTGVVYLNLVSKHGKHIKGAMFSVKENEANGYLEIPDSLSTGTFFLKVFVNQDRETSFLLKEILVINRFETIFDTFGFEKSALNVELIKNQDLKIDGLKTVYEKRESAKIDIEIPELIKEQVAGELTVSITKDIPDLHLGTRFIDNENKEQSDDLTEDRGIILNGKVFQKSTGKPVWGALVFLSIPDSIPAFDYCKTNDDGQFHFLLKDFYGQNQLVLQASKNGKSEDLAVEVESKFKDQSLEFSSEKVSLKSKQVNYLKSLIDLATFQKIYYSNQPKELKQKTESEYGYPFYGRPVYQVDPDLFFEMKDFNELSKELLMSVRYRERKEGTIIQLVNQQAENYFPTQPFMLLDGVPFTDVSLLANLGTREIDWVDVIPRERFYGDLKFNGVLAIYTKAMDVSLIQPTDYLLKLNYEGLQNDIQWNKNIAEAKNEPDFRQVLYWNPNFPVRSSSTINFKCSDVKGDFGVRISGVNKSGVAFQSIQKFKVE